MSELPDHGQCLNCGATLNGPFCAACGQRFVPPNPTVAELAGDAWHELSGYDGRIASTIRGLLHPGKLTRDYLGGQRARYLPPVRVYLIVSVMYFVVAAAAPNMSTQSSTEVDGPGGLRIGMSQRGGGLSDSDRAAILAELKTAPWYIRPLLTSVVEDPEGFRARLFTIMPRVFFGMLPVFAGIVALLYRERRFPTALVYAVHIHAFAFLIFTVAELAKFSGSVIVSATIGVLAAVVFAVYTHRSLQVVFGGSWLTTLGKETALGFLYALVSIPAYIIILIWASMV